MATIRIVVETAVEHLSAILQALSDAGVPAAFSVGQSETNGAVAVTGRQVTAALASATPEPATRKRADAGVARGIRTVYVAGKRMDAKRVAALDTLTPTQKTVAAFILKNSGKVGMRDVQRHFDGKINSHTVDGSIFSLRKHTPPVIESKPLQ